MDCFFLTTLTLILFTYFLLQRKKNKSLPPGPISLPIFGHFHLLGKNPHQDLTHLSRKYGSVMGLRFGFVPVVVISSPTAAETVLKTHDVVFASRPPQDAIYYLSYGQRNLVFSPYNQYWRDMRKLCTLKLLSSSRIKQFQGMRKSTVEAMVAAIEQYCEKGEIVDLSARVSNVSADIICLMIFGRKFEDRDLDEKGFKAVIMEAMEIAARFNVADYIPGVGAMDLQGIRRRSKKVNAIFDGFLEKIIEEHKRGMEEARVKDFVDTMMEVMESGEAEFEFDRRHVKAVLLDLLIAGLDTSATTVEWTLSELIRHPHVMKKLQREIEFVVGKDKMVEEPHIDKLEYLNFVVKESLRLHPPAPLLIPHESIEDCLVNGFLVPKKSRVIINVYAIGRDLNVWTEPEKFYPERFIGSDIDIRGHDFRLFPFGSGRRSCPGLELGFTVVQLMVAQLVHCFDWELPNSMKTTELDMTEYFGIVTARAKHLKAFPKYRLNK